jgi:hypothetical protein
MQRSDWIALIACVGTLLSLIPAFGQFLASKKRAKTGNPRKPKATPSLSDTDPKADKPMPAYMKAFSCTVMAFVILVIELVIFGWIAHAFGVTTESTYRMPAPWLFGFYALFLLPGLLLFLALLHILGTMDD